MENKDQELREAAEWLVEYISQIDEEDRTTLEKQAFKKFKALLEQ